MILSLIAARSLILYFLTVFAENSLRDSQNVFTILTCSMSAQYCCYAEAAAEIGIRINLTISARSAINLNQMVFYKSFINFCKLD